MVTTPVPPTPVTSRSQASASFGRSGAVRRGASRWKVASASSAAFFLSVAPRTVTKLGQKPLRQEKSLLQVFWLIWRLRPNSVSFGSTDRQLDSTPQSPQPSQTSSLMTAKVLGSSICPRLRRRRFSVAHICS